jgi:hypothetical protein
MWTKLRYIFLNFIKILRNTESVLSLLGTTSLSTLFWILRAVNDSFTWPVYSTVNKKKTAGPFQFKQVLKRFRTGIHTCVLCKLLIKDYVNYLT